MTTRGPWLHERRWPEIAEYLQRDDVALLPVRSVEPTMHIPRAPCGLASTNRLP